jgi:hypothetical protein
MSALRFLLLMKSAGARFVAGATYGPPGQTQAIGLSAYKVGDLVMIFATTVNIPPNAVITGGAGGWVSDVETTTAGYKLYCFRKKLEAADLSGVTFNAGAGAPDANINVVGYRGAASATLRAFAEALSGTTLTLPGFTKSVGCRRIVSHAVDRDPGSTFLTPTSWFARIAAFATTFFASRTADVPPSRYDNGTDVVWTGFDTGNLQFGFVMELT